MPPVYCRTPVTAHAEPGRAAIWLHCASQNYLTRVEISGIASGVPVSVRPVPLEGAINPASFSVADNGYLYVSDLGVLHVYDRDGVRVRSPFDGRRAGRIVDVGRSFSNFDPATMVGPKYYNVLPGDSNR